MLQLESNPNLEQALGPNERAFKLNDTNEIVAVPAHLSDSEVENFFQTQRQSQDMGSENAKLLSDYPDISAVLPDYYKQNFETPLKALRAKEMQEPNFILDGIENRARAFNTNFLGFLGKREKGYSGELDAEAMKEYPGAALLGGLTVQLPAIMATFGIGEALGMGKVAADVAIGSRMLLPQAAERVAGPLFQKAMTSLANTVMGGGLFGGAVEGAKVLADPSDDIYADYAKVGTAMLDTAVSFAPYSVGALIPSRLIGTSVITGITYALGRAQGLPEEDNLLNSIALGALHAVSSGGNPKESIQAVREAETAFVQSKNSAVDKNVAADIVDTKLASRCQVIASDAGIDTSGRNPVDVVAESPELTKQLIKTCLVNQETLKTEGSTGIDVNVTTDMKGAVASGEPTVEIKTTEDINAESIGGQTQEGSGEAQGVGQEAQTGVHLRDNAENRVEAGKIGTRPEDFATAEGDKTAKASKDINRKIVEDGMKEIPEEELAKYKSTSYKQQAEDFSDLMTRDPQAVKDMATGKREFPDGISPQLGFNAVKIKAILDGDVELVKELAMSPVASGRSQHAQELGAAGFDNGIKEADPIKAISDITGAREKSSQHLTQKVTDLEIRLADAERKLATIETKKSTEKATKIVKSKEFGAQNKLFTKEGLEQARIELKKKLSGLHSGVDPTALVEFTKIGGFYFEGGIRDFSAWSKHMTAEFGTKIKPYLKDAWAKITKEYYKSEREDILSKMTAGMADKESALEMSGKIQKLAENLVADGVKDRKTLVDRMHGILVKFDKNMTKRDVADAISGYGKFKPLNSDEVKATLRDLKGQLQNVSKLEDLNKGRSPLKTGVERRTPSDEERALIKQVEEAKKKYGIQTSDPATQLKSALDSIKTRLTNQISDLEKQILENKKIVREKNSVVLDKEAIDLTAKRDALKKHFDRVFGKTKLSDAQRVNIATKALERSIADLEKRIKAGDILPKGKTGVKVSTPELEALRAKRESLQKEMQELRDIANPPKSDLQILKDRLAKQAEVLENKLNEMDFAAKEKKVQPEDVESKKQRSKVEQLRMAYKAAKDISEGITESEVKVIVDMSKHIYEAKAKMKPDFTWEKEQDGIDYASANVAFKKYVAKLQKDAKGSGLLDPLKGKNAAEKYQIAFEDFKIITNFIGDNSKAILGSLDDSFFGRQGDKALKNPKYVKDWADGFVKSWIDIFKTLKGDIGKASPVDVILGKDAISVSDKILDAELVDIYRSKNYLNGRYNMGVKLDLATGEEMFPTSLPSLIPVLGRLFEASKLAYDMGALRLRRHIADKLYDVAEKSGADMKDKQVIGDINQIANEMTGRGSLGKAGSGRGINRWFFSIKNFKSNIDLLLRPFYPRQSSFARKQAAINLVSWMAVTGTVLSIAKALDENATDLDPTGDMFGKIKIGKSIPIDVTGGLSSLFILTARLMTRTTKNSTTGIRKKLGESYGQSNGADILVNFTMNKLSPLAGALRDYLRSRDYSGHKPTAVSTTTGLVTPIPITNVVSLDKSGESASVKIAALILDSLGFGMSQRDMSVDWSTGDGKEMKAFEKKVGQDKFREANNKFNDLFNERARHIFEDAKYKKLSDDDKQRLLTQEKSDIKDKVFRQYHFNYRPENRDALPNIK